MPGVLNIMNYDTGSREMVPRLHPHDACETLGVFISPDGTWKAQKEKMANTLQLFSSQLRTSGLSKADIKCALDCMLWKKLEYSYQASGLSESDWDDILKPVIPNILNACGTNRHFPRKLVYGPIKYQGLGFVHPFDGQMISQLITFIEEGNKGSISGEIISATTEQFLVELGTEQGLNTIDDRCESWITNSWIADIWKYCKTHKFRIHQPISIPLRRTHDKFIMDVIGKLSLSPKQLYLFNEVRMHLQVMTISDICDASGRFILENYYCAEAICERRQLVWPRKRSLNPNLLLIWKKC